MENTRYMHELIEYIINGKPGKDSITRKKIECCAKYNLKRIPTDVDIMLSASQSELPLIKQYLRTKPGRSLSGVSVVAIMTKPAKCPHGRCSMCPGGIASPFGDVPQSYTGTEPATLRGIRNRYDPYLQVFNRLEQYVALGHMAEKVELIIMGGTFPARGAYCEEFVKYALKAMNDFSGLFCRELVDYRSFMDFFGLPGIIGSKERAAKIRKELLKLRGRTTLEREQKRNEASGVRCIGLTVETRPDYGMLEHANNLLGLGCTRVELGVQSIYDSALRKIDRGHTVADSIKSTQILKDLGFKVNYHMMLGLPGVTGQLDIEAIKALFKRDGFQPDMLKLYPCMVARGTRLHDAWKSRDYRPLTTKKAAALIAEIKRYIPGYVRIMRIQRDIPTKMIEAGVDRTNLRQYVKEELLRRGISCRCIRCREPGNAQGLIPHIKTAGYQASKGREFFISAEDNDYLLGFCRMRFPSRSLRREITDGTAIIRELHVYGEAAAIGAEGEIQHRGLGKRLLKHAEMIAKKHKKNRILVISGIGVRSYYRMLGYRRSGPYMGKGL
ncbi:MAG: tRNA uridine(34) 5-carboxymethylaminomethyl modification radical SAM/GNAT enzyme Elp3 [archaeon]